jgi:RNA polymerase sigma-70 factor (ECF subfamily)
MPTERVALESTPVSQPRTIDPTGGGAVSRRAPIALVSDEVGMLTKLQQGDRGTQTLFFDKYERDARRVLLRILGTSPDVADALQETFLRALRSVSQVKDALALRSWLRRIAVTVAFDQLRSRQRLRWLVFSNDAAVELSVEGVSPELRTALRDTYRVLDKLPHEERIAFVLRHIQEMELEEIADACGVSLSTIKRRLAKAELRFRTIAKRQPGLAEWIDEEAFDEPVR